MNLTCFHHKKRVKHRKHKQQPMQHQICCLNIRPSTVICIWSASSKICCYVVVTQQRPILQQFASEFRNLSLQAKKRIQWTAKLITACYQNSAPESCAMWVSYCHCKN